MQLRTIKDIKDLKGKRVLLRVDFNVPLKDGAVTDDSRIRASLPTIKYLLGKGARIILVSHLGRPEGVDKKYSLAPVVECLSKLINEKVRLLDYPPRSIPLTLGKRKGEGIAMLENIRFFSGEEKNDPKFIRELASLADIFVNDAFSASHRHHASVSGVAKHLSAYAGLRLEQEINALSYLLQKPKKPFIAILGGAKISDKIGAIKNLSKKADKILLGGALINNFYKALGHEIGDSLVEKEGVKMAKRLLRNKKVMLPSDVVVGTKDGGAAKVVKLKIQNAKLKSAIKNSKLICKSPYAILDIGPETILEYAKWIKQAQTLTWNGPMGVYEAKRFSHGTLALGRLFAARSKGRAFGVAGGGETIDALTKTDMDEYVDWVSMGGGAMLEFLAGEVLPGIKALTK